MGGFRGRPSPLRPLPPRPPSPRLPVSPSPRLPATLGPSPSRAAGTLPRAGRLSGQNGARPAAGSDRSSAPVVGEAWLSDLTPQLSPLTWTTGMNEVPVGGCLGGNELVCASASQGMDSGHSGVTEPLAQMPTTRKPHTQAGNRKGLTPQSSPPQPAPPTPSCPVHIN